jgi:peptide chain release factor 1
MASLEDQYTWMDARYDELGVACSQSEIILDLPRWQQLMKERAGLEDPVQRWREYLQLTLEIASAQELLQNPELKDMAQEELAQHSPAAQAIFDPQRPKRRPQRGDGDQGRRRR